jgi:phosphoribosylformimino-5-aminoimidazole carboxamide ribotide isomerase
VQVIPAIDLERGRSRIVFWPGASAGIGAPTDRPEQIARTFVEQGAPLIHLVDFDGARAGGPVNLDAVSRVAAAVAVPLQLAGGLERPEAIQLAFAAGATRVVLSLGIADEPERLRDCVAVAGDWLAVGLDPRPERLAAFPWRRDRPPSIEELVDELVGQGVARLVLSHGGGEPEAALLARLTERFDADLFVAGGARDLAGIRRLRETGIDGIILGEALLSGALDYTEAAAAAAG